MSKRKKRRKLYLIIVVVLTLLWILNVSIDQQMRGVFVQSISANSNYTPQFKSMGQVFGVYYYIDNLSLVDKDTGKPVLSCKKATVSLNPFKSLFYLFNKNVDNSLVVSLRDINVDVVIPAASAPANASAAVLSIPLGKDLATLLAKTNIFNKAELKLRDADIHITDVSPEHPLDEKFTVKYADIVLDQRRFLHGTISAVKGTGSLELNMVSSPKAYGIKVHSSNIDAGGIVTYISYINNNRDIRFERLYADLDGVVSIYHDLGFDMDLKGKSRANFQLKTFRDTFHGQANVKLLTSGLELTNIQGNYKQSKVIGRGKVTNWMDPSLDFRLMANDLDVDDLLDLVPDHRLPVKVAGKLDSTINISGKAITPKITGSASSTNLAVLDIGMHTGADFEATNDYVKITNILAVQHGRNVISGNILAYTNGDYSGRIHVSGNASELLAQNLNIRIENLSAHLEMDIGLDSSKPESTIGSGALTDILWNDTRYLPTEIILTGNKDEVALRDITIKNDKTNLLANLIISSTTMKLDISGSGMSLAPFANSLGEEDWAKQIDMRYAVASGQISLTQFIKDEKDKHTNNIKDLSGHVVIDDIGVLRERFQRIETEIEYKDDVIKFSGIKYKNKTLTGSGNVNVNIKDMIHPLIYAVMHVGGNIADSMFLQLRFGQMIGNVDANIIAEGYVDDLTYHIKGSGENIYSDFGFADRAQADILMTKSFMKLAYLNAQIADGTLNLSGDIKFADDGNAFNMDGNYHNVDMKKLLTDKRFERMLTQKRLKTSNTNTDTASVAVVPIYSMDIISMGFASGTGFEERNAYIQQLNSEIELPESISWLNLIGGRGNGKFKIYTDDNDNFYIDTDGAINSISVGNYNGETLIYDVSFLPKAGKIDVHEVSFTHGADKEATASGEIYTDEKKIAFTIDFAGMELEDIYKMGESKLKDYIDFSKVQGGFINGRIYVSGETKKPDILVSNIVLLDFKLNNTNFPQAVIDMKVDKGGITANQVYIANEEETNIFKGFVPFPFDVHTADAKLELHTRLINASLKLFKLPVDSVFDNVSIQLQDKKGDIKGNIKLENGTLAFESLQLDKVNADIDIGEMITTNVKARQLYKKQNRYVSVTGISPKSAITDNKISFTVVSDPIYIDQPTMRGYIKLSGNLTLLPEPVFIGNIYVTNGEFTTDKAKLPPKPLPLELSVNAILDDTNAFIDDFINIKPKGSITVSTEKRLINGKLERYPLLSGVLDVSKGRIALLNQFNVTRGQAVFANINKTEPTLDVTAQTTIRQTNPDNPQIIDEYNIILRITGIAPYYQMSYEGSTGPNNVALSKYEVEKILGGDITSLNKDTSKVATKYAASALRLQLMRGFEQSVEDSFGLESFQFNLNPADSAGNNWDVNLYISKQLFPNVFVIYSPTYTNTQNKKSDTAELRYRLSNSFTIFSKTKNDVTTTGTRKDDSYGLEYNILF